MRKRYRLKTLITVAPQWLQPGRTYWGEPIRERPQPSPARVRLFNPDNEADSREVPGNYVEEVE